jgi:glucokinase
LGGGVTESGIFYLEKIREVVREHVIADCALNTEIVAASLGNKAGFIGAASLILK